MRESSGRQVAPVTYLITGGTLTSETTSTSNEFKKVLTLVKSAVDAGISMIQLREKRLTTRTLFELAVQTRKLTKGTATKLMINDRADIACAAECDGVHLAANSLDSATIRRTFGSDFIIGVSTHSLAEARAGRDGGADFAVYGPVFATPSKESYGEPLGINSLKEAVYALAGFPLVAIGGIASDCLADVHEAGAFGVAGITLFSNPTQLRRTVAEVRDVFRKGAKTV